MNIPSPILTLLVGIFVTIASLWYGQNNGLMPVAASQEAELVDGLFSTMITIGFGLFLLVEGALLVAVFRFRRKDGDEGDGEHLEGNIPLEIVWTAIPAVVVLGISIYSFDIYTRMGGLELMKHDMGGPGKMVEVAYAADAVPGSSTSALGELPLEGDLLESDLSEGELISEAGLGAPVEMADSALSINVQGLQYAFIFNYPDGIVDGELHIPVDEPVELKLNAQDVLHAFWLPEFRVKQDMIPGQETRLVINAIREGTYPVVCAELCGPYHGGMRTQLIVHSAEDYAAWVDERMAALDNGEVIASLPTPAADKTDAEYLETFVDPLQLAIAPESLTALRSE
ncbi:cytochrome c oxidase, subunit II [Synechococcus sp. PCC 7335]|uniref:cytochrome c oxidase subunit II n=1 Tax=Synechococcus sp. (strain ATCC 29403 / PCC 7335) TaxID=91464 RepID=UPI00017ECE2C|nr:cytochrome c oxidase subunit II transmembrane domain-containing protein [Synechococcus sp. PCC 7335]EDX87773.1 cytochrome c oxidase, subunit II [Synechococcus sp. PCC 7335]